MSRNLSRLSGALAIGAIMSLAFATAVAAAHPIYRSGTGSIAQTCGADLDNKIFHCDSVTGPNNDDIYFIAHTSTTRVLTYNNHIFNKILMMASKPSYATCSSAALGYNEYGAKKNVGHWFCVLTSEGRFARLVIDSVVTAGPMTVTFTTWCKPSDAC